MSKGNYGGGGGGGPFETPRLGLKVERRLASASRSCQSFCWCIDATAGCFLSRSRWQCSNA